MAYFSRPFPRGTSRKHKPAISHEKKINKSKAWFVHGHEYKHKGGVVGGTVTATTRNCACGVRLKYIGVTKRAR